jgi:hypothetical protein
MGTTIQRSFAGGEISPSIYGRVDQAKYSTGARTLRNFIVGRHGAAISRAGTEFVAYTKHRLKTARLIPFVFSSDQTYVIELGDQYMRLHKNGAQIRRTAVAISAITQDVAAKVTTSAPHGASTGDEVYISGVVGMTEVNGRNFLVNVLNATEFTITNIVGGAPINSTGFAAYVSGGTSARVFEMATPYVEADIRTLEFVQSADVITIVHKNYAPRNLSRLGETNWTLDVISFATSIGRPNGGSAVAGGAGANSYRYRVTAVNSETGEESLPGRGVQVAITSASNTNPLVITTAAAHGFSTGDEVYLEGLQGSATFMAAINNKAFTITFVAANQFSLNGVDGTAIDAVSFVASGTDFASRT